MYDALVKWLAAYDGVALLGLFLAQYLMVLTSPALIVLGLGIRNPLLILAGLVVLRLLFLCCALQKDVIDCMAAGRHGMR